MGNCKTTVTGCVPEIDNTPLECEELVSAECVVTVDSYNFFGIGIGETLSSVLTKIVTKVKSLSNTINGFTSLVIDPLAPGADCVAGGLEFKTVNAITGNLISTQYLCKEVYEGGDITCSATTLVTAGDTPSVALKSVSDYFCNRAEAADVCCKENTEAIAVNTAIISENTGVISAVSSYVNTLVRSVSGLNTDNTDPRNPIVQISVDGVTVTGAGTPGDPLVAAIGAIDSVLNGLYIDGVTAKLGGALTEDTRIDMGIVDKYHFELYGFYDYAPPGGGGPVLPDDYEVFFKAGDSASGAYAMIDSYVRSSINNIESFSRLYKDATDFGVRNVGGTINTINITISENNGITLSDSMLNRGAVYDADYSANYTIRSLVDKEYVDNKVTGYTGSYATGAGQTVTVVDGLITGVV